jgi:hypothetical protein
MSLSQDHSATWSSLSTLESILSHASVPKEHPNAYFSYSERPTDPHRTKEFRLNLNKRHQKLATAVALIGASSPESKTVTACCIEVLFRKDVEQPAITLRIAQNQPIVAAEMEGFQQLLNMLIGEVLHHEQGVWNVEESMFYPSVYYPVVTSFCSQA